ncbi:hypothetical protein KMP13_11760 [Epibacterium ulvae]|uniref:glycosyltransferase n=1 Tax=Epibacterium ulvae TaxID=1156985 RepID=UPI001BFCD0AA|nr:glycosyltransferase [Epibacterium ulvae]MBT8154563.1 hypothetical protein [Epibacterium ulvae]
MIFLTVGTQLPFDRLAQAMDDWCAQNARTDIRVFGQLGHLNGDSYRPRHFEWAEKISPDTFNTRVKEARVVVGHAGMGSIITAMSFRKPTVIMPRRAHLGEHRNDHQYATMARFKSRSGIFAVEDSPMLAQRLDLLLTTPDTAAGEVGNGVAPFAEDRLIQRLSTFIHNG